METLPRLQKALAAKHWGQIRRYVQDCRAGQVAAIAKVRGGHHVFGIIHLLGQLWYRDSTERVSATAGERREADHEKVETRKRDHVDGQFAEVRVELTGEAEAGSDAGHDSRHEMIEISV